MLARCPNCQEPIPAQRLFLTTAWGRWRCKKCDSLLGINVGRRVAVVLVAVFATLLVSRVTRLPANMDLPLVLGVFGGILVIHFLCFERARVIERCGFRCQHCGYDLQGQVEPRCPECGREFDAGDRAKMQQLSSAEMAESVPRRRWVKWVGISFLVALVVAQILGLYFWRSAGRRQTLSYVDTRYMSSVVLAYVEGHDGQAPDHTAQVLLEGPVTAVVFLLRDSLTMLGSVPLADMMLAQFDGLSSEQQAQVVQTAVERLGEGTIAHRLGDYVFTYHGIDFADADPDLWILVWSPDPGQNAAPSLEEVIPIGLADGEVKHVSLSGFVEELSEQNRLRVSYGLPPLVSPFTVTHKNPMVAQPDTVQP